MRIISTLLVVLAITTNLQSQNSYINNCNFEATNWQSIAWFSQTNTGSPVIVSQTDPFFEKNDIVAHSGLQFAYIGGTQNAGGLYEAQLVQEFNVPYTGVGKMNFYMRYIKESTDPGSMIKIYIDGIAVWSITPHFIVNQSEEYVMETVELGELTAGPHTIEIYGYENPLGGNAPMQFTFDDFILQSTSTSSVNNEENIGLNITCLPGSIQLNTTEMINEDANIELVDLSGKVISSTRVYFQNSYSLPVQLMGAGMYILNIKTNTYHISKKLFIQS